MSSSYLLDPFIINLLQKDKAVLDVGCGKGKWGYLIQISHKPAKSVVGVDIWRPFIVFAKNNGFYDDVVLCSAEFLPFKDGSFEYVLACEILEHFNKEQGYHFLAEIERIASEKTVISSPNFFFHQDEVEDNPYERHLSRWGTSELRKMKYSVRGIGFGLFGLRTPASLIMGLNFIGYVLPEVSYLLLAQKDLRKTIC